MVKHIISTNILVVFGDTFFHFDAVHHELCILDWIEDNNISSSKDAALLYNDTVQAIEVFSEEDYIALKLAFS